MNKLDFTTLDKVEQFLDFSRKNKLNFDNESTFEN